jgi:hypothetical protein
VARCAGTVLLEFAAAQRKLKDARPAKEVADDVAAQLQRLVRQAVRVTTPPGRRCSTCRATSRPPCCGWRSGAPTRPATPSAWPNCARWSSAGCAALAERKGAATPGWTNTAGCWKSCG